MKKKLIATATPLAMRLLFIQLLFIASVFPSYGTGARGQDALNKKISISVTNTKLKTVLEKVEDIVDAKFVFSPTIINVKRKLSFSIQDITVADFLKQILQPLGINYKAVNNLIILYDARDNRLPEEIITNTDVIANVIAKPVTGKVTNDKGESLIGVSVSEQGTSNGAVTNQGGYYSIAVAGNNSILVFEHVGYDTKTETVGTRTVINVVLQTQTKELEEIVVTALGIKKESRKLGYAASTVKVDEIAQNRTTNVMKSLEGKIAGLEIAPPTAGAGASTRIRLRGQSGFSGQVNSPLIVINGLPMDQDARSAEGAPGVDQGDNLQQINQDDIESMTVLKGSTAAALYGSRASNGAIIITTKSGAKNSRFGVEYTSNFAADEVLDYHNYQTIYGTGVGGNRPT
ncbi:MAG: TonB-dependent receptor plug domain-containing protein, partial [Bacteroidia bacterium]|nr:TonB-dependent receptor plug domain-containing protein [Bacteroidia bacterium]